MATKTKQSLCERADGILRQWVETDETPDFDSMTFLRGELNWDDRKIRAQRRRINTVMQNQAISGDQASRDALDAAASKAEAELAERGPELEKQIEELQKQLRSLEQDAHLTRKRHTQCLDAVERLRLPANQPDDIREKYRAHTRALTETLKRELMDIKGEIQHTEIIVSLDPQSHHDLDIIRSHDVRFVDNHKGRLSVTPLWAEFVKEQQAQLPTLIEGRDELQAEYDSKLAEINQMLDHYVR